MDLEQVEKIYEATFGAKMDRKTLLSHVDVALKIKEDAFFAGLIRSYETDRLIALRKQLNEDKGNSNPGHPPQEPWGRRSGPSGKGKR